MAEINKLSVGKVLDKLRSDDAKNSSKIEQLDEKIKTIDEETQRLRAQRNRLKRGRQGGTTRPA
jgi:hypothetical protein